MTNSSDSAPNSLSRKGQYNARNIKDWLTGFGMGVGGIGVIVAIVLIFFYLLYVVFPLFIPAGMHKLADYPLPARNAGQTLHFTVEEQNEVAVRFTDKAHAVFFKARTGEVIQDISLPVPAKNSTTSFAHGQLSKGQVVYGLDNGKALVVRYTYKITYPDDKQLITPQIEFPLGNKPITVDRRGEPLLQVSLGSDDEKNTIVALTQDKRLLMVRLQKAESMLSDEDEEPRYEQSIVKLPAVEKAASLLVDNEQHILYVAEQSGHVTVIDISETDEPKFIERVRVVTENITISRMRFLTGGISLLIGDSTGVTTQWFPVREAEGFRLKRIRSFAMTKGSAVTDLVTEQRRKGFVTANALGEVAVHHSTADRTIMQKKLADEPPAHITISPRADTLLAEMKNTDFQFWHIENEHPEISWRVLWQQVWYESYEQPGYTWQSSSASNDFEPKYSLVPLAFGTLKAAFYAMLFAVPLAIMGAIYTAYFMTPVMRAYVKPSIEIMEALPTVILGFLAGLWLAPGIEQNLPGVFSVLVLLPFGVILFAWGWHNLPANIRNRVPEGWQAAILVPVVFLIGWFSIGISPLLETVLFSGDMRQWMDKELGMGYDQRNSLVVGIAMGVAVIPTIFSITEDAIFSVPKHLTFGSLALGATPWQTMMRVVLLTASPGIFSAVMIGLGRAVGETMIVLMATGNTPVMDFSIFQGMRTLSANIAVEMPESEVNSTHYRVLFLAALVLFIFTFMFNTMAEIVRHRLRRKYSSL